MAAVGLFYHPNDSAWKQRFVTHLQGLARIDTYPLAGDFPMSEPKEPKRPDIAILLLSAAASRAPIIETTSRIPHDTQIIPVLVGELDPLVSEESVALPPTALPTLSLAGRPLERGTEGEVEALFSDLYQLLEQNLSGQLPNGSARSEPPNPDLEATFSDLFRRHYPYLVRFFGQLSDPELARDLAQETMIRLLRALPDFAGRQPPNAWVKTTATNVWRNWLRSFRGTQRRGGDEHSLDASVYVVPESDALWPAPSPDPQQRLEARQMRNVLHEYLRLLSPLQQQCLELWLQDFKYREIAEQTGVSLQTVRATLSRAKARLRQLLGPVAVQGSEEGVGDGV